MSKMKGWMHDLLAKWPASPGVVRGLTKADLDQAIDDCKNDPGAQWSFDVETRFSEYANPRRNWAGQLPSSLVALMSPLVTFPKKLQVGDFNVTEEGHTIVRFAHVKELNGCTSIWTAVGTPDNSFYWQVATQHPSYGYKDGRRDSTPGYPVRHSKPLAADEFEGYLLTAQKNLTDGRIRSFIAVHGNDEEVPMETLEWGQAFVRGLRILRDEDCLFLTHLPGHSNQFALMLTGGAHRTGTLYKAGSGGTWETVGVFPILGGVTQEALLNEVRKLRVVHDV